MQGNGNQGPPGYPGGQNPYGAPGYPPQQPQQPYNPYPQGPAPMYVVAAPPGMDTMQIVTMVWGIVCAVFFLVALFPCLGALNWINVPLALAGLIVSIVQTAKPGLRARAGSITGISCCGVATVFGILRLIAGGGVV